MPTPSENSRRDRSPFFGRSLERERLHHALVDGAGLITLVGPSGIGKTRLALQLAGELDGTTPLAGRIWFCSLAGCTTPADLEAEVARTLGIWRQQGDDLASAISNRGPLLLILDNADPTIFGLGDVLEKWLERCVELQLIVTSLTPVDAAGELVVELQPLALEDAVALYLDRARQAWADRSFDGEEVEVVEDLVRRLDRLPLAIELAAARVRVLPPKGMLSMLNRRFEVLRSARPPREDPPRALPRDASLLGAIESTWSHLDQEEQLVLATASVFEGGFSSEAALEVLQHGGRGAALFQRQLPVLELLESLRRKSLIYCDDAQPPRFFLQESVQEYASRELRRMERWEVATRRHAAYFLDHKASRAVWAEGPDESTSLSWLQRERANIVAIHRRFHREDPSLAARAGIALVPLLHWEGQHDPDTELPTSIFDACTRSDEPELLLRALSFMGSLHFKFGSFDRAASFFERAAKLADEIGDKAMEIRVLTDLVLVCLAKDELAHYREPLERALRLSEDLESPAIEGMVRLAEGYAAQYEGALDEAEASHRRAVALLRGNGRLGNSANACYSLGLSLASRGKFAEARSLFDEAIATCRALGYRALEAHVLAQASVIELVDGRLDEAERICRQSLSINRQIGNRFREGEAHCTLGIIALERGDLDAAEARLGQAIELFLASGATASWKEAQIFVAILEAKRDAPREARRIFEGARGSLGTRHDHSRAVDDEYAELLLHAVLARSIRSSDPEQAQLYIEAARTKLGESPKTQGRLSSFTPILPRLLAKEVAAWDAGTPPPSASRRRLQLSVGAASEWFEVDGAQRVELQGRRILRQIFAALLDARLSSPGSPLESFALIDVGWPGVQSEAIRLEKRLHMAIWTLRDLGLRSIILNEEEGYLLDPAVPVRVEGGVSPPILHPAHSL